MYYLLLLLVVVVARCCLCESNPNLNVVVVGGSDVSVGNSPVQKEELRFQLMQRHRREVEEEVAGINALLFEHVDGDKNGTIELDGASSDPLDSRR